MSLYPSKLYDFFLVATFVGLQVASCQFSADTLPVAASANEAGYQRSTHKISFGEVLGKNVTNYGQLSRRFTEIGVGGGE